MTIHSTFSDNPYSIWLSREIIIVTFDFVSCRWRVKKKEWKKTVHVFHRRNYLCLWHSNGWPWHNYLQLLLFGQSTLSTCSPSSVNFPVLLHTVYPFLRLSTSSAIYFSPAFFLTYSSHISWPSVLPINPLHNLCPLLLPHNNTHPYINCFLQLSLTLHAPLLELISTAYVDDCCAMFLIHIHFVWSSLEYNAVSYTLLYFILWLYEIKKPELVS